MQRLNKPVAVDRRQQSAGPVEVLVIAPYLAAHQAALDGQRVHTVQATRRARGDSSGVSREPLSDGADAHVLPGADPWSSRWSRAVTSAARQTAVVDELRRAVIRWSIGAQPSEDLPDLAARALVEGADSPALRELAGLSRREVREAQDLFVLALEEMGIEVPATPWQAVRFWAAQIVAGEPAPYDGACLIWQHGWEPLGRPVELGWFVGLASQWDDYGADRALCSDGIVSAAGRLIDSGTAAPQGSAPRTRRAADSPE